MTVRTARQFREAKGLSLRDVEREIEIDHSAIAKFETCEQGLGISNLQAYAQFLGCTIDELLTEETNGAKLGGRTPPDGGPSGPAGAKGAAA